MKSKAKGKMQKAKGKNQGSLHFLKLKNAPFLNFCLLPFALCLLPCLSLAAAEVSYTKDVYPVLRDNCLACHS